MPLASAKADNINSSILVWARETAGLSLEEAARKIGLTSSTRSSAAEKMEALEAGKNFPTRNQLLEIARVYRRPLTVFYLAKPPRIADRGEDFRTLPGPVSPRDSALLDALLRDARVRQDIVKSILEEDEDTKPLEFVNSISISDSPVDIADKIRDILGIKSKDWTTDYSSPDELFKDFRSRVETLGVFVLLIGNLGSHHTDISEQVFRGFAIADEIAPFIVINPQDAKPARIFTLAHELVHLFAGKTGVSGSPTVVAPKTPSARIERFCNDVAGEFLLPASSVEKIGNITTRNSAQQIISNLAKSKNLSESMIAYRLHLLGRIDQKIYSHLREYYEKRWSEYKQSSKELRQKSDSGPSSHVVRRYRLGNPLLNLVGHTLRENQITHTTAARILAVKPTSVEPLLQGVSSLRGLFPQGGG